MSRTNMTPILTFPDGSHLVVSTHCSKEGDFSCTLYTAILATDDGATFRIISSHLQASTCLRAQEYAYDHAANLYPRIANLLKKPPYLIWHGPQGLTE